MIRLTVQEPRRAEAVVGEFERGLECQAKIWEKIMQIMGSY